MAEIRFNDGAAYERMIGTWSRLVGDRFIDWIAPAKGLRWIDVGCGNGSFTERIVERCTPGAVEGIDPSEGQLAFARTRPAGRVAHFRQGDAQSLPFADGAFDAAVAALVLFFVPDPAKAVAEMKRVVRPGGLVCAYLWDQLEPGGFPLFGMQEEMRKCGINPPMPPSAAVSRMDAFRGAWVTAGLTDIETTSITVHRTFENFDDLWSTSMLGSSVVAVLASMKPEDVERVREGWRARLVPDASGRITYSARANAVKGSVPM